MNLIAELPKKQPFANQTVPDVEQNQLLASMPHEERIQIVSYLEEVDFSLNQVLCEAGTTPSYMYFPTTAVASLLYFTESGQSSEIAIVGNDGVVGMSLFLSGTNLPYQAIVQSAGKGFRVRAQTAINIFNSSNAMQNILLQYSLSMMCQISKTAICNRHHTVDQQLCRRLLVALDRLSCSKMEMTHEMLAKMLGVRRESITQSASKLQTAGAIIYRRGLINVLDRKALESRACECYDVVKN
ncbi:MAG: Crp/Fnr family transcriptional regulator [Methylophilaceae bacterium 17-44-8]|jgi:CRP-like cAMP-binding protein|nr:MAG: Crp/Fnr family transcriptional regulator [Methylophilaceae bacterium 17-44-8]